jgi:nucleoside-diphosphate-sugar epimerase
MSQPRANPTALVTGATGFVGSRVARHLAAAGWKVCALVRPESKLDQLKGGGGAEQVETFVFDGLHASLVAKLQALKPDVVFHLASLYLAQHKPEDIPALVASNITFGTQLLEAMMAAGVKQLVNTGTGAQHYQNAAYSPFNL